MLTTKKPAILIRVSPEIKDAMQKAANEEMRSISSLFERLARDWLRAKGYLK